MSYVSEEMSQAMSTVKKQLVAQDLNKLKQILSMIEEGVTNEMTSIQKQVSNCYEAQSEYIMIKKMFISPLIDQKDHQGGKSGDEANLSQI